MLYEHRFSYFHHRHLSELKVLYWSHTLRGLAMSLMGVFIPILLYEQGFTLAHIAEYLLFCGLFWTALLYPAMRAVVRFGPNRMMAFSTVISLIFFAELATFTTYQWPLWSIALSWGLMVATYWMPLRLNFAAAVKPEKEGTQVSVSSALLLATSGLAPAIGGLIAEAAGLPAIYAVGFMLILVATWPLFVTEDVVRPSKPVLRNVLGRQYLGSYIANAAYSTDDVAFYFWPILVYLVVPSYVGVGLLSSVIVLTSIVVSLHVGRRLAQKGPAGYLREASVVIALTNALRALANATSHVFALNLLSGIGHSLLDVPYFSRYYDRTRGDNGLAFVFLMQVASAVAWIVLAGVCWLVATLVTDQKVALAIILLLGFPFSFFIARIR